MTTVLGFGVIVARPLYRYPTLVLAVAMVFLARRHAVGRIRILLPLLLLLAWTIASLAWTDSVVSTSYEIRANMSLVVATMVVASLAPLDDLVSWQVRAFGWSLVVTVAVLVLDPASRISVGVGPETLEAWRGGFIHKNGLAMFAAFAVPWVLAFEMRRARKWLMLTVIVVLVLGSRSATGVVAIFLGAAVWAWLGSVHRRSSLPRTQVVAVTIPIALFCAVAIWSSLGTVAELLGKELTLTGRTAIWREGLEAAAKRPLAGYGPGGL
ncbi:MAG TPA: O-antigen ligase family protein, partial [Acidimicrobiales bacterium]|nr:O-antigen ligase family protein [Acidimicrobiales bacterium]